MIYLNRFSLLNPVRERDILLGDEEICYENKRTCYRSRYPFGVFTDRTIPVLEFETVTILCGGNGSGKTTILNLIGEKLGLKRTAPFNKSSFFNQYLKYCRAELSGMFNPSVRENSRVIASDDVFDELLELRQINEGIIHRRKQLLEEYTQARYSGFQMRSLEDLDRLRQVADAQSKTGSRYVNDRLLKDIPEHSNGENGFLYFTREIKENGLYLLDEPENSLSPNRQLELLRFLEDSARFYRCQFIISTHSPFLLSMKGAKIYDLDRQPVQTCSWTELEHVQSYYQFFKVHEEELNRK